jgi:dTDP-glucose pyrophosphorylase
LKNVILLCAGKSSRFGRNKLEERFEGKTLPHLAAKFAVLNGCENLYLTLSQSGVKTDGTSIYHPILEEVSEVITPRVCFQESSSYGPGAAITAWAGVVEGPFVVLFGDNLYQGRLSTDVLEDLNNPNWMDVMVTYQTRSAHPRNLQLAAISEGFVIEKPHSLMSGTYFCGFVRFPLGALSNIGSLKKSDRGEVEITDMINMANSRSFGSLEKLGVTWGDLTYENDCEEIRRLLNEGK